jgi:KDO2-lipid IV(A) lauroyltransferase
LGVEVIPADASAGTAVLQAVKAGRTLALVADRDILGTGVEVEFFGETTKLPAGPATLALRGGAVLLPAAVYFSRRGGHVGVCKPPVRVERTGGFRSDVGRLTQVLAREMEDLIRRAPDQWHLMQPNWPSDLEALERRRPFGRRS